MLHTGRQGRETLLSVYSANLGNLISRRRSERALRDAAKESELASHAKSEFLANMSPDAGHLPPSGKKRDPPSAGPL